MKEVGMIPNSTGGVTVVMVSDDETSSTLSNRWKSKAREAALETARKIARILKLVKHFGS